MEIKITKKVVVSPTETIEVSVSESKNLESNKDYYTLKETVVFCAEDVAKACKESAEAQLQQNKI